MDQLCVQIISTFVKLGHFVNWVNSNVKSLNLFDSHYFAFYTENFALSKFRKEKNLSGSVNDLKFVQIIVSILHNIAHVYLCGGSYVILHLSAFSDC